MASQTYRFRRHSDGARYALTYSPSYPTFRLSEDRIRGKAYRGQVDPSTLETAVIVDQGAVVYVGQGCVGVVKRRRSLYRCEHSWFSWNCPNGEFDNLTCVEMLAVLQPDLELVEATEEQKLLGNVRAAVRARAGALEWRGQLQQALKHPLRSKQYAQATEVVESWEARFTEAGWAPEQVDLVSRLMLEGEISVREAVTSSEVGPELWKIQRWPTPLGREASA